MCSRSVHDNFTTGSGRHDDTEGADGAQRMTKNCSTARMSRSGVSVVCEARNRTGSRRTGARRRRFPKISPSSLVGCSSGAPASGYQDDVAMGASPKRLAEHCHAVGIARASGELVTSSARRSWQRDRQRAITKWGGVPACGEPANTPSVISLGAVRRDWRVTATAMSSA